MSQFFQGGFGKETLATLPTMRLLGQRAGLMKAFDSDSCVSKELLPTKIRRRRKELDVLTSRRGKA